MSYKNKSDTIIFKAKIVSIGNSNGVIIPKPFFESKFVKKGHKYRIILTEVSDNE